MQREFNKGAKSRKSRRKAQILPSSAVPIATTSSTAVRNVDQARQRFDAAAEEFQFQVDNLRALFPQLVEVETRRDRESRVTRLVEDGIVHCLQDLAKAIGQVGQDELPKWLIPHREAARLAIEHFSRVFAVEPLHQPGDTLEVSRDMAEQFDWSAAYPKEDRYPVHVKVVRSGWRAGDRVLVAPRVVRIEKTE